MKTFRLLSSLAAIAVLLPASALPAAAAPTEAAKPKTPEWTALFGDASLPVVWQSARAASEKISAALQAQSLAGVADWAETIRLATHALADQVKIDDAERATRLARALEQSAEIADQVLAAVSSGEKGTTKGAFDRLQVSLVVVNIRLPKDIANAPAQAPRFAKASGRARAEKGTAAETKK